MKNKLIKNALTYYLPPNIIKSIKHYADLMYDEIEEVTLNKLRDFVLILKLSKEVDKSISNKMFQKVKNDYYTLIVNISNNLSNDLFKEFLTGNAKHIFDYYINKEYKNIEDVIIQGSNIVTPLIEALSLGVDYNLLRNYYKGINLKKVEKILIAYALNRGIHVDSLPFSDYCILKHFKKFSLFRFFDLINNEVVPLIYKDGVLLTSYYSIFEDFKIYDEVSYKKVIMNIVKMLLRDDFSTTQVLSLSEAEPLDYIELEMFPFLITMTPTDYGYVINLFKYNELTKPVEKQSTPNTVSLYKSYDLIGIYPVHRSHYYKSLKVKQTSLENIDSTIMLNVGGADDKYMYLYSETKGTTYKIPFDD